MQRGLPLIVFLTLASFAALACSSTARIASSKEAYVALYNEDFELIARLGKLPVQLSSEGKIGRFGISSQGHPTEFLIVVKPSEVEGDITLPIGESEDWIDNVAAYGGYLDSLLECHRLILQGKLDIAKERIQELIKAHNYSYGTSVLLANIHLIQGDYETAASLYELAKSLHPGAKEAL